jgi:hypothetical protein
MVRASFDFDVIGDAPPPRKPLRDQASLDQGAGATVDTHGLLTPNATETVHDRPRDTPAVPRP